MLNEESIQALYRIVGQREVIIDPAELIVYEVDAAQDRGYPEAVVFPSTAEQVCQLARWSLEYGVPLISRGAGTGLSGGAVAEHGGLIVEFSKQNRILELDEFGRSAVLEPGVITQNLDEQTRALGLYYPPDPSSGRSSTLGGNVAENAGGPHCFKYGVTSNYITGLDVVLADGQQVRMGGQAFDYPEYDFGSLLAGSEGTLGLITRITVRLLRQPAGIKTMMAAFKSVGDASRAVSAVISAGLVPATMELMDQKIVQIVDEFAHPGIPTEAGAILIVDVDGYSTGLDAQLNEVASLFQLHGGYELRIAHDIEERDRIWYARKSAVGALARLAPAYLLLDGTVPRSRMAEVLQTTNNICDQYGLRVGYVSHAGDGNLHPLILMYPADKDQVARVQKAGQEFMREVTRMGGSITGEHGVGIEKRAYLSLMYSSTEISAMLDIKRIFDPTLRLNPGKIFPSIDVQVAGSPPAPAIPEGEWQPTSAEDAASGLAALTRAKQPVWINNNAAALPSGQEIHGTVLKTYRMNTLKTLSPTDLYVVAGAGMKLSDLQTSLAREGAWLPVAAPWPETTLGGLISTNLNAPLRMRYGSLRDQVLAMTIVLPDGRLIRMGRPVVKNVAGYDLTKLLIGSYGTLGLIAEVTMKFTAMPRSRRSLIYVFEQLERCLEFGQRCLSHTRIASAVVVSSNLEVSPISPTIGNSFYLTYTAEGLSGNVEAELDLVSDDLREFGAGEPIQVDDFSGTDLWKNILGSFKAGSLRLRCAVAPKDIASYVIALKQDLEHGSTLIDFANGFVYAVFGSEELSLYPTSIKILRKVALAFGGYLVVLENPGTLPETITPWGYHPETLDLMKKLKASWDPQNILNRGIFLPEIC